VFLLNGVVLFTRKVFLTTVIERKKAQKRDGTMTLPIRIEKDEIPFFIAGCAVEGMRYEEWHAERERGDDPSAT
jgi:hypothetical protein